MVLVTTLITPDSQVLRPALNADYRMKFVPTVPPGGTAFDCTAYVSAPDAFLYPLNSPQKGTNIALTLSYVTSDATSITYSLSAADLKTVLDSGFSSFAGYCNALDVLGNKALVWAGSLLAITNSALNNDFL